MKQLVWGLALVSLAVCTSAAQAQFQAFTATDTSGAQSFGGPLGMDFTVNSNITISQLGVFDSGLNGLSKPMHAEIWSRSGSTGNLLTRLPFTAVSPGTLTSGYRLKNLNTPLVLAPGTYTVVAHAFLAPDNNGNTNAGDSAAATNTGGGLIAFGGGRFTTGAVGLFPSTADSGTYHAGSFVFAASPTGPATLATPVIIDNGQPGYSTSGWSEQGGVNDAFNTTQGFNTTAGNAAAVATYNFTGLAATGGLYEVLATWRQFGQSNVGTAQYDLDGQLLTLVDQSTAAGGPRGDMARLDSGGTDPNLTDFAFQSLGTVAVFDSDLTVQLRLAPGNNGFVLSDAVAVRLIQALPEPATIGLWSLLGLGCVGVCVWRRRK